MEYLPEWGLIALMLRQLLQIPYVKDLVKHFRRNPRALQQPLERLESYVGKG